MNATLFPGGPRLRMPVSCVQGEAKGVQGTMKKTQEVSGRVRGLGECWVWYGLKVAPRRWLMWTIVREADCRRAARSCLRRHGFWGR